MPSDVEQKILEGNADNQYPVGDPEWDKIGYRHFNGTFSQLGYVIDLWNSSEFSTPNAWRFKLTSESEQSNYHNAPKNYGFSVRCFMD